MSASTNLPANVKMWLADRLPADVSAAIDRLARTDDARHIAVMPDVHLSHDVCVGTILATTRLIYPNAVGGDIGCGMAATAFDADADVVRDETRAARLLSQLPGAVPAIRHASRERAPKMSAFSGEMGVGSLAEPGRVAPACDERSRIVVPQTLDGPSVRPGRHDPAPSHVSDQRALEPRDERHAFILSDPRLESIRRRDGVVQLGTLGRGNHFLEFQSDDENRLWLMVHSGSRAIGPAVRDWHLQRSHQSAAGFNFLDAQTPEGQAYLADADWTRRYASENRRAMVNATATLLRDLFAIDVKEDWFFDCDHNHVRREIHFGQELWVHRKGATPAQAGERGIIAGSMGTESYHVEGRGCETALGSSSHGAGRAMGRDQARRRISPRDLDRQLRNVWFDPRLANALRDEAPSAYKDIRAVMRAQKELTRIVRRVRPVLCYKSG